MADIPRLHARIGDYVVRVATLEDYQSIVDIDVDLFDGFDYLPTMFYEFLQSKRHILLVFEDGGKPFSLLVVSFDADEPTVASMMSARISQSKRGRGIWYSLMLPAVELIRQHLLPTLTQVLYLTQERYLKFFESTHLYRLHVLVSETSTSSFHDRLAKYGPLSSISMPRAMTYAEVIKLLMNGQQWEQFFSQYATDYVVGMWHWKPVKIHGKSELREMFCTASLILVTANDQQSSEPNQPNETPKTSKTAKITSLSCSYVLPVKSGVVCHIMFYGEDPLLAAQHEIEQVRHLTEIWQGDVGIVLLIPNQMNITQVISLVDRPVGSHRDLYGCAEVVGRSELLSLSKL